MAWVLITMKFDYILKYKKLLAKVTDTLLFYLVKKVFILEDMFQIPILSSLWLLFNFNFVLLQLHEIL